MAAVGLGSGIAALSAPSGIGWVDMTADPCPRGVEMIMVGRQHERMARN
jgi:hypothetical protein